MTTREALLREIDALGEPELGEAISFVRWLRVSLASEASLEGRFQKALDHMRQVAAARGLTEEDVAEEVRAVREGGA